MPWFRLLPVASLFLSAHALAAPARAPRLPEWAPAGAGEFPHPSDLPEQEGSPDPLVMFDGEPVADRRQWPARRRELLQLFQHYMYGYVPPLPDNVEARVDEDDPRHLGGLATRKRLQLRFGPRHEGGLSLLLILPNGKAGRVPCVFGLDLAEEDYAEASVKRGYAFATFLKADLAPDSADYARGVYPLYYRPGQNRRGPHEWGALGAWAWGLGIAARQLAADPAIDPARLAVVGHSRKAKAALLAGALYESIAMVIAHQSGTTGAEPVYRLLGAEGLKTKTRPTKRGSLSPGRLGFYVRGHNGHAMDPEDWKIFLDYADGFFRPGNPSSGPSRP